VGFSDRTEYLGFWRAICASEHRSFGNRMRLPRVKRWNNLPLHFPAISIARLMSDSLVAFISATQDHDDDWPVLHEVNPVAWTIVDPHLTYARVHWLRNSGIAM
jgi:hypothetical protein